VSGPSGGLPWPRAHQTAYDVARPLPGVELPLVAAGGTTLAEPLPARAALPPFDSAAMDGYAVNGPPPWRVVGSVRAGQRPADRLRPGTAVEVATGAPAPPGTDAVVPYEVSRRTGDRLSGPVEAGRHLRRAGEECAAGDPLLPAGSLLTPVALGLAAAAGWDTLLVRPAPRVRLVVTGDELVTDGLPTGARVRDALGPMLPGLLAAAGARVTALLHLPDRVGALAAGLTGGPADEPVEVVVTTGASARGPADHLRPLLADLAADVLIDGVACRPGHPQLLARLPAGGYVVGLPGNPLAAVVGWATLLRPLLAGLAGRVRPDPEPWPLLSPPAPHPARTVLLPVRRVGRAVAPLPHAGPAMLRGAARAYGLAVLPPGTRPPQDVDVLPLP
jgi:molybdopterin molybdotransferase